MGVKACQCNEHKNENDLVENNEEIVDNSPYEIYSLREGNENDNKENGNLNDIMINTEMNKNITQLEPEEELEDNMEDGNNENDGDQLGNQQQNHKEKHFRQIQEGPPLEIINENYQYKNDNNNENDSKKSDENNDNDDHSKKSDDDNDNDTPILTTQQNQIEKPINIIKTDENTRPHTQGQTNNTKPKYQPKVKTKTPKLLNQKSKSKSNLHTNPNYHQTIQADYSITNLIPQKKLDKLGNTDIVFLSGLERMINNHEKKAITYSNRFCVLTPQFFSYYTTKENFMSLKKPLCQLDLKLITKIEKAKVSEKCIYFSIMFTLTSDTLELLKGMNSFLVHNDEEEDSIQKEGMIGFKSINEDLIHKWVALLQYFTQKIKESCD